MDLETPISSLAHTSPLTIKRFKSLNINTYWDLINYFPFRYEDYSLNSTINKLQPEEKVTIKGQISKSQNVYTRGGFKIQKIILEDSTGSIELIWFNQSYLLRLLKPKSFLSVSGKVEKEYNKLHIKPVEYEILADLNQKTIHTGKIIAIYSEKRGLSSKLIREKINLIPIEGNIKEIFPKEIISFNDLISEDAAYQNIHFPQDKKLEKEAKKRLSFDEFFTIQLATSLVKKQWHKETVGQTFSLDKKNSGLIKTFIKNLPFELTASQKKCSDEILGDLKKQTPMNRLLQGDVGSGKTVLAAIAAYLAHLNGFQTLIMAPTEILAQQHLSTIKNMFDNRLNIALVTGSQKVTRYTPHVTRSDIIIGTQALIQKKIKFDRVGLVVVDEQHRFGVKQRAILKEKGINPHLLTMTATPIPRTVALTLYGELDISYLNEMPKGRLPIKSYFVPKYKRMSGYEWLKKKITTEKIQAFIVCPLIEESEIETMKSVKAVKKEYEYLKKQVFPDLSLGLLHGKLKAAEKNKIMDDFKDKKIDILVTTSVVEVGIDIPNATVIIIEGAERYGLAQLHQLRGRVGRSDKQSYCFVYSENESDNVKKRLNYFVNHQMGNELAQYDLDHRGAGELFGIKQHGMSDLKIASLSDYDLIEKTKNAVSYFNSKYNADSFPVLKKRLAQYQINQISKD